MDCPHACYDVTHIKTCTQKLKEVEEEEENDDDSDDDGDNNNNDDEVAAAVGFGVIGL